MVTEQLLKLVEEQVMAVGNLKIGKITVWDSGKGTADGETRTAGFLSGLVGFIPPMHELARNAGVEHPACLGTAEKQPKAPEAPDPNEGL